MPLKQNSQAVSNKWNNQVSLGKDHFISLFLIFTSNSIGVS